MGPLRLADLVGMDVTLAIIENIFKETGDSKYRPVPASQEDGAGRIPGPQDGAGLLPVLRGWDACW